MARHRRAWAPGLGAHLISRFVDRRFHLVDDCDRKTLLESIDRAHCRWDWELLSYALMSSHPHYGTLAGERSPDAFLRSVHTRFASRYHRRHGGATLGPVFAERSSLHVIKRDALARMVAYHHRNPVTAGVVTRPVESRWTSHRAYLRLDPAPRCLNVERALSLLGFNDTEAGRRHFDSFVQEVDLSSRLSEATDMVERAPKELATSAMRDPVDFSHLEAEARALVGLPPQVPLAAKSRSATRVRRLVAMVAMFCWGESRATVARYLGIRPVSVSNLLGRPEPSGDLDALLQELLRRLGTK